VVAIPVVMAGVGVWTGLAVQIAANVITGRHIAKSDLWWCLGAAVGGLWALAHVLDKIVELTKWRSSLTSCALHENTLPATVLADEARMLTDMVLEDRLRAAIRDGQRDAVEIMPAEVRRRFEGQAGMPAALMEDWILLGRRVVAAAISLVILATPWVLGLGVFLWTFAVTDSRSMAFAVSVLLAWIAYMAIQLSFIFWWGRRRW
jgi:hypothetical protein